MPTGGTIQAASARGVVSDEEAARLWQTFLCGSRPESFAAFDELYARFRPALIRFCRFRLRDPHLAEDVANGVFVRLLETRPALKSSFIGLLFRAARNECASELCRRQPRRVMVAEPVSGAESDPSDGLERRATHAALADCLDRLAEQDRALVVLRHGEGLTYAQITDALGLRVADSTLTRRVKRIKDRLRRCLKEKNIL